MTARLFASPKALIEHAEQNGLVYVWVIVRNGLVCVASSAFAERQKGLSADQYEIVDVHTPWGVRRAMLLPKAILEAEFVYNMRDMRAIKRNRLRAKRASRLGARQRDWPSV